MKRLLNYPGSKWKMAQLIISLCPEHTNYLEPYAGSLAVFFNKEKVLCDPYSREEQTLSYEIAADKLEDARRMMVRLWFSIGGKTNHHSSFKRNTI